MKNTMNHTTTRPSIEESMKRVLASLIEQNMELSQQFHAETNPMAKDDIRREIDRNDRHIELTNLILARRLG